MLPGTHPNRVLKYTDFSYSIFGFERVSWLPRFEKAFFEQLDTVLDCGPYSDSAVNEGDLVQERKWTQNGCFTFPVQAPEDIIPVSWLIFEDLYMFKSNIPYM